MTEKRVMKLASRGKRFGAACIDVFVPFVSYLMISAVLLANGINSNYPGYGYGNNFGYGYGYGYGFGYGYGLGAHRLSGASAAIMVVVFFILLAYIAVELVLFSKGKTIGKAMIGMQVVSSTDGKPFGFWKMLFRECFAKSASASVFFLGFIWVLIDEKNRGWHDKILDSYVVDLKESEKMNYLRHLQQVREAKAAAAAPEAGEAEPVIAEVTKAEPVIPEVTETEPVICDEQPAEEPAIPEVRATEEPVTEAMPEVIAEETGAVTDETAEAEKTEAVAEETESAEKETDTEY